MASSPNAHKKILTHSRACTPRSDFSGMPASPSSIAELVGPPMTSQLKWVAARRGSVGRSSPVPCVVVDGASYAVRIDRAGPFS